MAAMLAAPRRNDWLPLAHAAIRWQIRGAQHVKQRLQSCFAVGKPAAIDIKLRRALDTQLDAIAETER